MRLVVVVLYSFLSASVVFFVGQALAGLIAGVRGRLTLRVAGTGAPVPLARRRAVRSAGAFAVFLCCALLWGASFRATGVSGTRVLVQPGWPAHDAGLRDGDQVVAVDRAPVTTFEELRARIQAAGGRPMQLGVLREGVQRTLEVTPGPSRVLGLKPTPSDVRSPSLGTCAVQAVRAAFVTPRGWGVVVRVLTGTEGSGAEGVLSGASQLAAAAGSVGQSPMSVLLAALAIQLGLFWPLFLLLALGGTQLEERRLALGDTLPPRAAR